MEAQHKRLQDLFCSMRILAWDKDVEHLNLEHENAKKIVSNYSENGLSTRIFKKLQPGRMSLDSVHKVTLIYLEILTQGLDNIKRSILEKKFKECHAEAEHLHNIPIILSALHFERDHQYYIEVEIPRYLAWNSCYADTFSTLFSKMIKVNGMLSYISYRIKRFMRRV